MDRFSTARRSTRLRRLLVVTALSFMVAPALDAAPAERAAPRVIENFVLRDAHGTPHALADFADRRVVVVAFLGVECPLAKLYGPKLARLAKEYEPHGVSFLGIDANAQDSTADMQAYARESGIAFPWLKDDDHRVADQFGAERTPEVFLLDEQRNICYRGRIDDQCGVGYIRSAAKRHDLREALDAILANKPVVVPRTEAVGCIIGRVRAANPNSEVTYSAQIAPLLQRHCVECHRPGEIAPFSLTSYEEVVGWAETIAEVVREDRMPPWHANPAHGRFVNARGMTTEEKQQIATWVEHGAPEGDPAEQPPPLEYVQGWRLSRPPDHVVAMRKQPFRVPAEGTVEYQYFVVDPGFTEDRWVSGAEVIPGNRSVVHHAIVFFRAPEGVQQRGLGWLTAYVPGQSSFEAPSYQARHVPAGSKFIFQMHYTTNGSPQDDLTKVGLLFTQRSQVREELLTLAALNHDLEIPPHAVNHLVEARRGEFPAGAKLLAIAPHMHVRGRSFRVELEADGMAASRQILLDVPRYDFNWQHAYTLAEPLPLDASMQLVCSATFDNSQANRVNPDPSAVVRWGDQTWQEMMIAFFEIAVPLGEQPQHEKAEPPLSADDERRAEEAAQDFLRRFDRNRDGRVQRNEVPAALATFAFGRFDADGNGGIDHREALENASRTMRRQARKDGL